MTDITDMVEMIPEVSAEAVIKWYEAAKQNPSKSYIHKDTNYTNQDIVQRLKEGNFTPDRDNPEDPIWGYPYFYYKKAFMGIERMEYEELIKKITLNPGDSWI